MPSYERHRKFLESLVRGNDRHRKLLVQSSNLGQQRMMQQIFRHAIRHDNPMALDENDVRYLKRHRHRIRTMANPCLKPHERQQMVQTGGGWMGKVMGRLLNKGARRAAKRVASKAAKKAAAAARRAAKKVKVGSKSVKAQVKVLAKKGISKAQNLKDKVVDQVNTMTRNALDSAGGGAGNNSGGAQTKHDIVNRLRALHQRKLDLLQQIQN